MQDMLSRQGCDDTELLGVEQDGEPGNPVGDRAGVVVQEPTRVCPPAVLATWTCKPGRSGSAARAARPGPSRSAIRRPAASTATCGPGPGRRRPTGRSYGSA